MNETGRAEDGAPVIAVPLRVRGHKEFNAAPQMGRSEAPLLQKLQCCKGKKAPPFALFHLFSRRSFRPSEGTEEVTEVHLHPLADGR